MVFHTYNRTLNGWAPRNRTVWKLHLTATDGTAGATGSLEYEVSVELLSFTLGFSVIFGSMAVISMVTIGLVVHGLIFKVSDQELGKLGFNRQDFVDHMMEEEEARKHKKKVDKMQAELAREAEGEEIG